MPKKLTQEEFIAKAVAVHGVGRYDYSQTVYVPYPQKIAIKCLEHGVFMQVPAEHLAGRGCSKCGIARRSAARSKGFEGFIKEARQAHGDRYDYTQVIYKNGRGRIKILCPEHGTFEQIANGHILGQGCPKCAGVAPSTTAAFIAAAEVVHGKRYDYSQTSYRNRKSKVTIICLSHGAFKQTPNNHIGNASGCPRCKAELTGKLRVFTVGDFVQKAHARHGIELYDYSLVEYKKSVDKVKISCSTHGIFEQEANSHLQGKGCPVCAVQKVAEGQKLSYDEFIERAVDQHGARYNYSLVNYTHGREPVTIICPTHGPFEQPPHDHLGGKGCIQCGRVNLRKSWTDQANGRPGVLYLIRLFNDHESFYKIGVTYNSVKVRYTQGKALGGYQYEVLAEHKSSNAVAVWEWEQSILETFAHLRYKPKNNFGGETECFSSSDEILAIFPL
jgi:hypothetical protein